jgi:hypothetical protein
VQFTPLTNQHCYETHEINSRDHLSDIVPKFFSEIKVHTIQLTQLLKQLQSHTAFLISL